MAQDLSIPANKVFLKENLDRIPIDKTVVVVCKSGARATAIGTALRHIGFKNVYVLKGGIVALTKYVTPKSMNPAAKQQKTKESFNKFNSPAVAGRFHMKSLTP